MAMEYDFGALLRNLDAHEHRSMAKILERVLSDPRQDVNLGDSPIPIQLI